MNKDDYIRLAVDLLPYDDASNPAKLTRAITRTKEIATRLEKKFGVAAPAPSLPPTTGGVIVPSPAPVPALGGWYVDPFSVAAIYAQQTGDAAAAKIAAVPTAIWLGGWTGKINDSEAHAVRWARAIPPIVADAKARGQRLQFVIYDLPLRDFSGQHSAGGVTGASPYKACIDVLKRECRGMECRFIVEPDALADLPNLEQSRQAERIECIQYAVQQLAPEHSVFIDASHPRWVPATDMASRLTPYAGALAEGLDAVGMLDLADGFVVNVSNRRPTVECQTYGEAINLKLPKPQQFLIDTSRNGVAKDEWCNPIGERIGTLPDDKAHTFWGKRPGESDGPCNGGPPAGAWWPERARELVS